MGAITSSQIWIWFVGGLAVVMIGGYVLVTRVSNVPKPILQAGMQNMPAKNTEAINMENPLLTATKTNTYHWFPSFCFAAIYAQNPPDSHDIASCIPHVIKNVRVSTGVTITEAQVMSPEVLAHFKKVFTGKGDPWRQ